MIIIAAKIAANASQSGKLHHTPHIGCSEAKRLSGDTAIVESHWNSNGRTAVNGDGFVIDTGVEEFVIEGGKPMPSGSYSFRMDDNGKIINRYREKRF